jgi:Mg2+ and Co2+ transporter CorA
MMRKHINQLIAHTHPTGDGVVNMEDVPDFDYCKTVLFKFAAHLHDLYKHLDPETTNGPIKVGPDDDDRKAMLTLVRQDLAYLLEEANTLIELCDAGRSMVLSSFSLMESKRAAQEARLVTALTKATNRVTFIFLPISFVTSVFGMNFNQFGQGALSIWLWVEVTLPLLIVSVVIVEYGSKIRGWIGKAFS